MVKIVCEGRSDKAFLEKILKHLDINYTDGNFEIMGNKSSLLNNEKYEKLKEIDKTQGIKKILFVLDSDSLANDGEFGGYENSQKAVEKLIKDLKFSNSDYFIVCDPGTKEGYLESLILSTISEEQKECINNFLDCSEFKEKEHHKAILNQIYGLAYPDSPFDFSHEYFEDLKKKIRDIFR